MNHFDTIKEEEHTLNQENTQAKVALVTGGSRRIGAALVQALHLEGYQVIIHCRKGLTEAQALAQQLNKKRENSALVVQKELRSSASVQELIATAVTWAQGLDLLINNASIFTPTTTNSFDFEAWEALFDIHVKIPWLLSLAAFPLLKKQQGSIINITDIHAERPLKGYAVYCQSKAALKMQTEALAREFAPEVRVNAIAPGSILWPEGEHGLTSLEQQKILAKIPLKKQGKPEHIAQAVLALVKNPYITGQTLKVDGGRSL